MNRLENVKSIAALITTLAAALPLLTPHANATVVFSSGPLGDPSNPDTFRISDTQPTFPVPLPFTEANEHYRMTLDPSDPASPITARSITFFGFSVATPGQLGFPDGELDHGFELILGPNLANILAIQRTDLAANPFPLLVAAGSGTDVQQITLDFDPVTVTGGDDVLFRGTGGPFSNFYAGLADPNTSNITLTEYSEPTFTIESSTTTGLAFAFFLNDTFQVIPEPTALTTLVLVFTPLLRRRRR
ncbi:MAG: hypothetical protein AAF797_17295 [Planctomycetota bacterium]